MVKLPREEILPSGHTITVDFSEDEVVRRFDEIIRRAGRQKPSFNLKTGQPYEGPQLSNNELRTRGYK